MGAYGLRLVGLEDAKALLQPAHPDWPTLTVELESGRPDPVTAYWDDVDAELNLHGGGTSVVTRRPLKAVLTMPQPAAPAELVHPFLAATAAVVNRWYGREAFHGGAFIAGGRAWVILGERESGKSSTVACLARKDVPVLCDDLVIVAEDNEVLCGPRCVDLREEAAAQLGVGEYLGFVGSRQRWRYRLPPAPSSAPLGGWILPRWGDRIAVERISGAAKLGLFADHLTLRGPTRPERLLGLSAFPVVSFIRPQGWTRINTALEQLVLGLEGLV